LFISIIFTKNFSRNGVDFEDLIRYFDCSPIKLLYFSDDFKTLTNSGILIKIKKRFGGEELTVNNLIKEAILQNRNIPEKLTEEITDIIELLQKIYSLGVDRESDEKSTIELFAETKELLQTFQDFPLIQKINQFNFQIEDTYFFLYLILLFVPLIGEIEYLYLLIGLFAYFRGICIYNSNQSLVRV
jgi:hypothetical protein